MKTTTAILLLVTALAGCATAPVEPINTVTVDKPIPLCPTPPDVPKLAFKVDQLTVDDLKDPGKVGQAYTYDMTYLRAVVKIYDQILAEYAKTSANFAAVKADIDKTFSILQPHATPVPEKPKTP